MSAEITLTCEDVNAAFRRVAANTLEVAAQELDVQMSRNPDEDKDPGRKWSIIWLQTLANSMRNEEEKNHDQRV